MSPLVHVLFLLSGATALALEVLWMGALGRVFGGTAEAAAATLAAFFLGLGAGAAVFGRVAPRLARPLRAYGLLEIGVALTAGLGLLAGNLHAHLYGVIADAWGTESGALTAAQLLLALLLVGPGAFLMGGTLPVLGEHVVRAQAGLGRRASLLYAVNTLGAAAGALLATFALRPALGARTSWLVAAGTALAVGCTAAVLGRRPSTPRPAGAGEPGRGLAGLAFASGFLALALQVLWMRVFARSFPNSIYVFGAVIVTFLVALAAGAMTSRALMRRPWRTDVVLAWLLGLAGVGVAATVPAALLVTEGLRPPPPGLAWDAYVLRLAGDVALCLGLPVLLLGTILPWLFRMAESGRDAPGRALGRLAAWNTVGAVLGSLAAAFLLVRVLGLWASIRFAAVAYAALGLLVAWRTRRGPSLATAFLALGLVGASFLQPAPAVRVGADEVLLAHHEGPSGSVAVIRRGEHRKLVFDNVFTLGGTHDVRWEGLQAHVPLMLHPAPKRVMMLGLGTGITAGAALAHPVERVEVIEIVPDVIRASQAWFAPWTGGLFSDPGVEIRAGDARHEMRWTQATYDVVIGDLFFPWEPGTAYLYTREHFAAVKDRLAPEGLFAQWLPCYQLSMDELRGIARTMTDVFPHVTLWRGDFFADRPLLALVGHRGPFRIHGDALRNRARGIGAADEDLAQAGETVPLHLYAGNLTLAPALLADARPLTDDDPWIAWSAPKSERRHQQDPASLAVGDALLSFERALAEARPPGEDPVLEFLSASEVRFVEAGLVLRKMAVRIHARDRAGYMRALREYVRRVPADVRPDLDRWIE